MTFEVLHQSEVPVILWVQHLLGPTLDAPFIAVTSMGNEIFYMLLLPLLYWTVDRRIGVKLTIAFFVSAYFNVFAKLLFHQPRPFEIDNAVRKITDASGGGMPSGHTQNTVVVWGVLAEYYRKKWLSYWLES